MKSVFCLFLIIFFNTLNAQNQNNFERKGFIFGTALGLSSLSLKFPNKPTQSETSLSFPNFKIGAMISPKTALILYLPGSIYTYKNEGRERDRGFEAITPSLQYWFKDRFWVLAGAGLGMDAPAFYDIKNETERKFYFGGSALAGTGYEVYRKGKFALDLQARLHYGTAKFPEGTRSGLAFNLMIGFNWY
jgi:hypothetical protein